MVSTSTLICILHKSVYVSTINTTNPYLWLSPDGFSCNAAAFSLFMIESLRASANGSTILCTLNRSYLINTKVQHYSLYLEWVIIHWFSSPAACFICSIIWVCCKIHRKSVILPHHQAAWNYKGMSVMNLLYYIAKKIWRSVSKFLFQQKNFWNNCQSFYH